MQLTNDHQDGRLNSAIDESRVIDVCEPILAKQGTQIIVPEKARFWYDFAFHHKGKFYPVNIKITSGLSADNVSSKEGLYHALTGFDPKSKKLNSWENYIQALSNDFAVNDEADYYFLVIFKNEAKVLFTSLKQIHTLVPNGNNLPFQCCWGKNIIPTDRDLITQSFYLLDTFVQSYTKRSPGLDKLLSWRKTLE